MTAVVIAVVTGSLFCAGLGWAVVLLSRLVDDNIADVTPEESV